MRPAHRLRALAVLPGLIVAASAAGAAVAPGAPGAPVCRLPVIAELPHDPAAFTQGLLYADGRLYESLGGWGRSALRRLDPASGAIEVDRRLPRHLFGEGLARARGQLLQLTWQSGWVLRYDPGLRPLGRQRLPIAAEGWGLAAGGDHLYWSDGSDRIRILSPESLELRGVLEVRDGPVPVTGLNELEMAGEVLLANVYGSSRIAVVDRHSGRLAAWLELGPQARREQARGGGVLNGIALDAKRRRLFVTGKNWRAMYVLRWPADGAAGLSCAPAMPANPSSTETPPPRYASRGGSQAPPGPRRAAGVAE